jgi:hypothetical protein
MTTRSTHRTREKHFLDTSVARPLLLASEKYRQHLAGQFATDSRYISVYVQMEIRRSFIRAVVAFYALLQLPMIPSIEDALNLWSNQFKQSRLKAVIQLIAQIVNTHSLDFGNPIDKRKALQAIAHYVIRFEDKLRRSFKDPGQDTTRCTRGLVPLPFYANDLSRGLEEFAEKFDDTEHCRNNCSIDHVLLRRYLTQIKKILKIAKSTPNNSETRGFHAVASQLAIVLESGSDACSCHRCEKIGDAVIALETPRQMILEHSDRSFNYLCPPLDQPHRQHPSEATFYNESAT